MGRWHTHTERWLSNEHLAQEAAAEEAFAQVFAALPAVEPSEHFVRKTVHAAWQAQARRKRSTVYAALAASLMAAAATGVAAYGLLGATSGWLIATVATAAASSAGPLLVAATVVIDWWTAVTHTSGLLARVVGLPQSAAVLLAMEVAGGAALYALHRLLRAESGFRDPGPLCL
jgi:hypothetical protein